LHGRAKKFALIQLTEMISSIQEILLLPFILKCLQFRDQ
jgi:hypothetical protein